jgi:hypothetical protein
VVKVIKAPEKFVEDLHNPISIFLAGSIEMGKAEDWQTRTQKALEPYLGTILNPRRDDWDSSWKQTVTDPQFSTQVRWEQNGLKLCDIVFMYFDPKTQSPITLLEFGQYCDTKKMIVCCPQGFWRRGNLEVICTDNKVPLYEDFDEALVELKKRIEDRIDELE